MVQTANGMERALTTVSGKHIKEFASDGYTAAEIAHLFDLDVSTITRHFAAELAQGRSELEIKLRQFDGEIASLEGREAIYWEKYLIAHVRVTRIKVSNAYMRAKIGVIPFRSDEGGSWTIGCAWNYFHYEKLLWLANVQGMKWHVFFAPEVIDDVTRIRSTFASTDKFEPYDFHFFPLVRPLQTYLGREALVHLRDINEQLDAIKAQKEISPNLCSALEGLAITMPSYPDCDLIGKLLEFLDAVESESGKSLTQDEADRLRRGAYLVGRVLGGPF